MIANLMKWCQVVVPGYGSMMGAWCDDISFSVLLLSSYATIAVWIIVLRRNCCLYIRYDDMQCITNIKF